MNMSDTKKFIKVIRKEPVGDDIPIRIKLKITDKLSEIREQLQIDSTILMDDTLFFSDRDSNNIMRKRETEVYLEDIIIDDTIYLKTCDPSPDYFKGTLSLEYGRTLTPINSKIEIAEKKAFTIDEIELIRPDVTSNNEKIIGGSSTIATSGIPAANLNIEVGLNNDNSKSELKNLERKTSSLIGGETNFNKKKWVISLCDYKTWRCIEFQDPINIFELLNDNLRKDIYKVLGKKILYYDVISREQYLGYGEREILKLPLQGKICETINNKDADCCVFATVVDEDDKKNDFFNCQIYYPPQDEEVPRLIIHCYQKQKYQSKRKLKIGFMIIGYDVNFNSSDKLNDEIRVEVINNPKLDMSKIEELITLTGKKKYIVEKLTDPKYINVYSEKNYSPCVIA
uniref:DUF7431 domain-containing protein n=1 Tax=Rhizophagus irregularis (strain DAOM 181602 / DAOM 197198 / MUCL 43194) TaxID=747089 RepID=U9SLQ9_RHIID